MLNKEYIKNVLEDQTYHYFLSKYPADILFILLPLASA